MFLLIDYVILLLCSNVNDVAKDIVILFNVEL